MTGFLLVLAFAIFGQAISQDRVAVQPVGPECKDKDKGDCQGVCNILKNQDGSPNQAGCAQAFNRIPPKALCPRENEAPYLVGCDMSSDKKCTTQIEGNTFEGVWCACYYRCYDRTAH